LLDMDKHKQTHNTAPLYSFGICFLPKTEVLNWLMVALCAHCACT